MAIKTLGPAIAICSMVFLSGCVSSAKVDPFLNRVEAKGSTHDSAQEEITLSGRAEPYQEVLVSPSMEGKLKNILADVGAYVKQGDKLAELDEGNLAELVKRAEDQVKAVEAQGNLTAMEQQIALNQTMASINQAMVGLNTALPPEAPRLPEMSGFPELEAAKTAVKDAELALTEIKKEWEATNELFKNGLVSQQEMDQMTSAKNKAALDLERAQKKVVTENEKVEIQQRYEQEKVEYEKEKAKYEQEKAKYDQDANNASEQTEKSAQDTMKLQQASVAVTSQMTEIAVGNAKLELEAVRSQYDKLPIVAPVNGFITEKNGRIGEMVSQGDPLFVITNLDMLYISIDVPEAMINRWKEKQPVTVTIPTQDITKKGKVVYVGLLPNEEEKTYPVKVLIDNADHKIRGGMQAVVTWKVENAEEASPS